MNEKGSKRPIVLGLLIGLGLGLVLIGSLALAFSHLWKQQVETTPQASSVPMNQAKTSKDTTSSSSEETSVIPKNLQGIWYARHPQTFQQVTMKLAADGQIQTTIGEEALSITVRRMVQLADSDSYRYVFQAAETNALPEVVAPFTTIQGMYLKHDYGVKITDGQLEPIVWEARSDQPFDYSKPMTFTNPLVLTKNAPAEGKKTFTEDPTVDTKNLTTAQVNDWAIAAYVRDRANKFFSTADYMAESQKREDGIVYIQVQENHATEKMRQAGTDPNVNPTVGWYRVNASGELEQSLDGGASWSLAAQYYLK